MYADVVFPLKLPPLTYRVPPGMPPDLKGRIVKAPLRGGTAYGLVVDVYGEEKSAFRRELKELLSAHRMFATEQAILFVKWLSTYYITPMGLALKSSFFEEALAGEETRKRGRGKKNGGGEEAPLPENTGENPGVLAPPAADLHRFGLPGFDGAAAMVQDALNGGSYRSFLLPSPSVLFERLFLLDILRRGGDGLRGVLILVPEIGQIPSLESLLKPFVGERLCVLHSKLGKGKRVETIGRILSSKADVVLGTRSAVLSPLQSISLVMVMGEHSPSYKGEERFKYNGRDVAVMRGYLGNSCVLLSSPCPSIESVYNARIGKYTLLREGMQEEGGTGKGQGRVGKVHGEKRPVISIVAMKAEKKVSSPLSAELVKRAQGLIAGGERLLFLVNRKGYSLVRCIECGSTLRCGKCDASLVFHKGEGTVQCRYCGDTEPVPDICPKCGGAELAPLGAGTERIREELENLLSVDSLVMERKREARGGIQKKARVKATSVSPEAFSLDIETMPLIIGTAYAKRLGHSAPHEGAFGAAAFLNIDLILSQPDFRAYERAFQEVMQMAQMVRPGGSVYLQSYAPKSRILRLIRGYDFDGFYDFELAQRKALEYPPFAKMILMTVAAGEGREVEPLLEKAAAAGRTKEVEVLGPVEVPCPAKAGRRCFHLLIKAKERKALHEAAAEMLRKLESTKGLKVSIDVDPLRL
ncbi:MAG: primosomal protein N' [Alphaproteobacteria bacterium]|uniref:Probable replication restart protein PriA n=1 Tax=Candidatus Nitrobium versatile TaxID=2884831 RepID=A0A953M396_9BACT|nr:primosomal protein N' [Candidatus Nitrobium versatile]